MIGRTNKNQGTTALRVVITIPGSGSNGGLISTLAALTTTQQAMVMGVKIHKYLPNLTTQRPAMYACDSATVFTAAEYIAAGEDYYEPATIDGLSTYVRSASVSTIDALAIFIMTGSPTEN